MALIRFNPFRELLDVQAAMDRVFGDTFPRFFRETGRTEYGGWSPVVDVSETDSEVVFNCELPGFGKDQINISVENGRLTITGERKFLEDKSRDYHHVERWYGNFHRTWRLPVSVDAEKTSASLKNGVLTITFPKKAEAKPKQIPVSVQ